MQPEHIGAGATPASTTQRSYMQYHDEDEYVQSTQSHHLYLRPKTLSLCTYQGAENHKESTIPIWCNIGPESGYDMLPPKRMEHTMVVIAQLRPLPERSWTDKEIMEKNHWFQAEKWKLNGKSWWIPIDLHNWYI